MEFVDGVDLGEARKRTTEKEFEELQAELAGLVATLGGATLLVKTRSTPGRLVALGLLLLAVTLSWLLYEDMSGIGSSGAMSRELAPLGGRRG